jgi:hypothetical protein
MLIRLSCFILLLSYSCCSFGQLQFSLDNGLVLGCDTPLSPNATIDVGSIQVGSSSSAELCLVNTGATPITVTSITLSTTDFDGSGNVLPIVVQPNKGSVPIVGFNFKAIAAGTKTAQVSFIDDAPGSPQTFTLSGTGFTDFGLNTFLTASNSQTVTAGQTATYTMSATGATSPPGPTNFTGTLTLSCSNLPPGASCSFSPIPVALLPNNEFINFQLNVSTTARPVASLHSPSLKLWYSLAAVFALVLAVSRKPFKRLAVLACFLILGLLTSCGGSSNGPPAPTPAGTFSFVVNGSSNGVTHSKTMVLVVK